MGESLDNKDTNYTVNETEYQSLRDELRMRIEALGAHNLTALTIVIAIWALGASIVGSAFNENISETQRYGLLILQAVIFAAPMFFLAPFSLKNADHFRQITSISCYIRVFYELPFSLRKDTRFFGWESLNQPVQKEPCGWIEKLIKHLFNREYLIMGGLSICLYGFMAFLILSQARQENANLFAISIGTVAVFSLLMIIGLIILFSSSNTNSLVNKHSQGCLNYYLEKAIEMKIIKEEEKQKAKRFLELDNKEKATKDKESKKNKCS